MSETAWQSILAAVDKFRSRPSPQPPFTGFVGTATGDSLVVDRDFVPEASYFSVRLVEMRLAEGGKYFTDYLPLAVCVAEFKHGGEARRVPLILSNEMVKKMLGDAGGEPGHVYFTNMPFIRWAPVTADNLGLFVGLFRMPYSDIARSVLQLAADVSESLGGAAFASSARIASKLYDRVADIFSLSTVQPRFAYLNGKALTKSGYLLVSGPLPKGIGAADFVVDKSKLRWRDDSRGQLPEDLDYCLLAIEQRDSLFASSNADAATTRLKDLASLPFHERWRNVSSLLAKRKATEAEEALLMLRAEVIASPDLTEEDRLIAIGGYDVAYALYEQPLMAKAGELGRAMRGYRSGTAVTGWKAMAAARKQQGDGAMASARMRSR